MAKHFSESPKPTTPQPVQPQQVRQQPRQQARPAQQQVRPVQAAQPYVPNAIPSYSKPKRSLAFRFFRTLLCLALIAAIFGGGVYFFLLNPPYVSVSLNGEQKTLDRGTTIQALIDDGTLAPTPGNLLALDGTLLEEGGGTAFSAKVNGQQVFDAQTVLGKGDIVEIGNGEDVVEEATVVEETIPHGTAESDTSAGGYWNGSLHVYEKGQDGLRVTTTGTVSGQTETREVTKPIDSGYRIYSANTNGEKVIALTFDDGPWPDSTEQILDILEENGAKATFFEIGNQIQEHTDQVKRAQELGMEIYTHTWDHASGSGQGVNLTYMSAEEQISEVQQGMKAIEEVLGTESAHIMRAPGGNFYGDLISTLEPYIDAEIGWDVDTEDWKQPGSDAIYEAIMSAGPGDVVLMHDGGGDRSQTVEAVRRAVPELIDQGYRLITISELLEYQDAR